MKKTILRVVALALLAVMVCAMFVSCGGPSSDPDKAADALKEAGYTVVHNDGSAGIGGISISTLPDGVSDTIVAYKDGEYIAISYYNDNDALKEAWEDAEEGLGELKEEYEDLVCKKSGKMIYVGTKQAIKDAK